MFRIVQLSDLHCGQQFFLPQHLERAIAEVNEMEPNVVVISGDLTTNGFKDEYILARDYLNQIECESMVVIPGNHDSRNVGYVHFEELFGERNSVLNVGRTTIVAVDSSEPDLDNGQVGRGRYRMIEEAFAGAPELSIFVLHHHLLPVPGTGRERNIVHDAGDTLECLQRAEVDLVLVGGTEKLRGGDDYGVQLVEALDAVEVDLVVDLSDEPVLGPRERMLWASRALALGLPYLGSDFRFDPPSFDPVETPSLAVIGLGKRIGKTAVAGHVARVLARDRRVVVVAMGRGGPAEPELIEVAPTLDDLLALSRSGRHAASDHLEAAALAGVPAVGCRRAGGGLAGAPFRSNVLEGARLAAQLEPELLVFDGSGAALPPVETDARILVTNGSHDARAGLNAYRVLVSDLVVDTGGADREAIRSISDVPVVAAELRLRPAEPLAGRRTAVFTTGPAPTDDLDGEIVHVSRHLARRDALLDELERVDAEVYLVELKAAAVDVVEAALSRGAAIVLAAND